MTPYMTRAGKTQYKPTVTELQEIIKSDNSGGFCLACGADTSIDFGTNSKTEQGEDSQWNP